MSEPAPRRGIRTEPLSAGRLVISRTPLLDRCQGDLHHMHRYAPGIPVIGEAQSS
jgi:hypothetical protein